MKKTILTLTALLALSSTFTSCTKDEAAPTPEPTPIPVLKVDIRDTAEGIFTAEYLSNSFNFRFAKDTVGDGMFIFRVSDENYQRSLINVQESEAGFTYRMDGDAITGEFNMEDDIHEWVFDGDTIIFNRD